MAITRLVDVFGAHRKYIITIALIVHLILLSILGGILAIVGTDTVTILITLISAASLELFGFAIILHYSLEPLDIMTRAVTHVSGQVSNVQPPNLNGTRHETTGFKLMVDTIYELAVAGPSQSDDATTSSALVDRILNNMPCGIIALDEKRRIVYSNQAAPVVSSDTASIQLLFDTDDSLETWLSDVENNQLSATRGWSRVQNALPDSPHRRVYDVVAVYQKNGSQGVDTILATFDRSDYYAVNEESMDFIALAAHELRGPVTVIRGYLDVLQQELTLQPDQKELFDRLEVSANRLSGYIGNILNASKFDRRHLKLHLHEDTLAAIYSLVADDLALRASTQQRVLTVAIPDELPTIAADRGSLTEVIANFVDNAIKYSHEGGTVNVDARVDGDVVRVSVSDAGIGIPSAVVGNLFSKFYRSHRSRQTVAGTGLGLYISKAIVESHGGHVSVSSKEGEGSTFSFSIPIYSTVADKLRAGDSQNQGIIESSNGWIKNHSMIRR